MAGQRISLETAARIKAAWPALLAAIAAGEGIKKAIEAQGLSTDMIRAYRASEPSADTEWARAKEESADAFSDEGLEVSRNPVKIIPPGAEGNENGSQPLVIRIDPAFARVHVDYLKWLSAKRNPRQYSDKAQLDVNVRTIDLTRIISEANARLAAAREPRILEHEPPAALPAPELAGAAIVEKASKLLELL